MTLQINLIHVASEKALAGVDLSIHSVVGLVAGHETCRETVEATGYECQHALQCSKSLHIRVLRTSPAWLHHLHQMAETPESIVLSKLGIAGSDKHIEESCQDFVHTLHISGLM